MKRSKHLMTALSLTASCFALVMLGACASGPFVPGDSPPMVDQADAIVFSYELAKPKPVPEDTRPLGNTRWQVTSINPKPEKAFTSMILFFQPDGSLVETTRYADGSARDQTFRYHIIGSTMIINKPKEDVNARFRIEGDNQLVIDTGEASLLLRRMK